MSIKKQYVKSRDEIKVTFRIPKDLAPSAAEVRVVGEFNNWNTACEPMKKLKSGEFTAVLSFPRGENFQFKYLLNEDEWLNDPEADAYVANEFGQENSVLTLS